VSHKIAPEHVKKVVEEEPQEIAVPTIGKDALIQLNKSGMNEG
jgi:hypothetical protein